MSKFHFDRKAVKFRSRKSAILEKMANNSVQYFKVDTFDNKAFNGKSWSPNKVSTGRQQLVKTGRMRESISVLRRTTDSIIVGSNVPYAQYHNEGSKNLPQRKFIGSSAVLEQRNKMVLLQMTSRIL